MLVNLSLGVKIFKELAPGLGELLFVRMRSPYGEEGESKCHFILYVFSLVKKLFFSNHQIHRIFILDRR